MHGLSLFWLFTSRERERERERERRGGGICRETEKEAKFEISLPPKVFFYYVILSILMFLFLFI